MKIIFIRTLKFQIDKFVNFDFRYFMNGCFRTSDLQIEVVTTSDTQLDFSTTSDLQIEVVATSDTQLEFITTSDLQIEVVTTSDTQLDFSTKKYPN